MAIMFNFDYHLLDVSPLKTTIGWNYINKGCTAVKYSLQGFSLDQITSNQLTAPRIAITSSSPTFSFPTRRFALERLYWRISGFDEEGRNCTTVYAEYYNIDNLLEIGMSRLLTG